MRLRRVGSQAQGVKNSLQNLFPSLTSPLFGSSSGGGNVNPLLRPRHLGGVMVGHGVEYMPHQRCVPSRNPKIVLAGIFSQISNRRYSFIEGSSGGSSGNFHQQNQKGSCATSSSLQYLRTCNICDLRHLSGVGGTKPLASAWIIRTQFCLGPSEVL